MRRVPRTLTLALFVAAAVLAGCGEKATPVHATSQRYDRNGVRTQGRPDVSATKNIVLIVIDTLRADCLVKPDGSPGVMPAFAALREKGLSFDRAFAPAAWTEPSMTSLLTGLLPREHGCTESGRIPRISDTVVTYAEVLRNTYGYETAIFTDMRGLRSQPWSIFQGFVRGSLSRGVSALARRPMEGGYGFDISAEVLDDWMSARDPKRPFCLLLHTFDAHDPYGRDNRLIRRGDVEAARATAGARVANFDTSGIQGGREFTRHFLTDRAGRDRLFRDHGRSFPRDVATYMTSGLTEPGDAAFAQEMRTAYERGARWVDSGLEATVAALRERGLLNDTLLVVTADHGEAFGEHGTIGHGHHLHREVAHVPLVLLGPGPFSKPAHVDATVSLMDVFPTFFEWAGIELPTGVHGQSLLATLRGEHEDRVIASETTVTEHMAAPGTRQRWMSRRSTAWTYLIRYDMPRGTVDEFVYRASDGEELRDLAADASISNLDFPDPFCEAIEEARDLLWAEVANAQMQAATGYGVGVGPKRSERPAPCGTPR